VAVVQNPDMQVGSGISYPTESGGDPSGVGSTVGSYTPGSGVGAGMRGNVLTNGNSVTVGANGPGSATVGSGGSGSGYALQQGSTAPTNPNGSTIATSASGLQSGMLSPQQIDASQPATQQQFGGVSLVNPDTYSATDVDTATLPGALQQSESLNSQALQPLFQQQQMSLDDNLASRGIVNSGASTYLNQNLAGQQADALAGMDAPLISQFAGYQQQDQLANAGYQNQAGEFNAGAGNAANFQNADATNAMNAGNTAAYNNWTGNIESQGSNYGNNIESQFFGTYGTPDTTAENSLNPGIASSAYENGLNNSNSGFGNAFSAGISQLFNQNPNTGSNINGTFLGNTGDADSPDSTPYYPDNY